MLLLFACFGPETVEEDPATLERSMKGPPNCTQYAANETTWSLCVAEGVRGIQRAGDARAQCDQLSVFVEECEAKWIAGAIQRGTAIEDILDFCRDDECRLLVLDDSRLEWPERLPLCETIGSFAKDCAGHAFQNWLEGEPTREDIELLVATETQLSHAVGEWSQRALARIGLGCDDVAEGATPANLQACRTAAASR